MQGFFLISKFQIIDAAIELRLLPDIGESDDLPVTGDRPKSGP